MTRLKANITRKENGHLNFKDIFLETLEQDRYGITRDNDDNDSNERVLHNTAKSYSSKEERVTVDLPNIQNQGQFNPGTQGKRQAVSKKRYR